MQRNRSILQVYVGWDINDARESIRKFGFNIREIDENTLIDNSIDRMRVNVTLKDNKIVKIIGCY